MQRYWQDYPPAHLLLRALAGFKPAERRQDAAGFDALAALAPNGRLNLADPASAAATAKGPRHGR